jgi:hypothetical protein
LVFITEMKSVYCAVRTGCLNKAVCASSLSSQTVACNGMPTISTTQTSKHGSKKSSSIHFFIQLPWISTESLTLSLLMSYIYGAPRKARNVNVVYIYIWTYVWQRWKPSLSICCTKFQHWISAESYPVAQLCVNTLPATKITLITDGI